MSIPAPSKCALRLTTGHSWDSIIAGEGLHMPADRSVPGNSSSHSPFFRNRRDYQDHRKPIDRNLLPRPHQRLPSHGSIETAPPQLRAQKVSRCSSSDRDLTLSNPESRERTPVYTSGQLLTQNVTHKLSCSP